MGYSYKIDDPKLPRQTDPASTRVDWVVGLLSSMGDRGYIGEGVSQLEHALQGAYFAAKAGASDEEILAALLHDIGHVCAPEGSPEMAGLGIISHESIGANLLRRLGFAERVATLVEGHVQAKRYLVSRREGYLAKLSPASRGTLDFQGGPMGEAELREFEQDPDYKAKLRVRTWDEQAKELDLRVPDLASYRAMILRHLEGA